MEILICHYPKEAYTPRGDEDARIHQGEAHETEKYARKAEH